MSDREMRALNKRFRRIDKTTDVLSFGEAIPARDRGTGAIAHINGRKAENGGRFDIGEILISAEQAGRQARRRKRPARATRRAAKSISTRRPRQCCATSG